MKAVLRQWLMRFERTKKRYTIACNLGPVLGQDLEKVKEYLGITNGTDCVRFIIKHFVRTVIDVEPHIEPHVEPQAPAATPEVPET
jgi:hypothetical protein